MALWSSAPEFNPQYPPPKKSRQRGSKPSVPKGVQEEAWSVREKWTGLVASPEWYKAVETDRNSGHPTHPAEPLLPCPGPGALVCEPQQPDHTSWGTVQSAFAAGEYWG